MNKMILIGFLLIFQHQVWSQQSNREDFNFMYRAVQQLPSFKDQFRNGYQISIDTTSLHKQGDFDFFMSLYSLISPLRDNHLAFYVRRDTALTRHPLFEISKAKIDSLQRITLSSDSVTGTYYQGDYQISLVKYNQIYIGVMENQGRYYTQFVLKEITPNHFDMIGFVKNGEGYFLSRNHVFINNRLTGTPWKKYREADHIDQPEQKGKFEFRMLSDHIGYLRLGSFATFPQNIAASEEFYGKLEKNLAAPHLIVDLRNNLGGGSKTSRKFYEFLKNYKGKIHLLVNNYTVSNAEQFVIDTKNWTNVTIYGETTRGTICYGSNMDKTLNLPSKRYTFYPTDMRGRPIDLSYESFGIKPQVELKPFGKEWVAQVVDYIKPN